MKILVHAVLSAGKQVYRQKKNKQCFSTEILLLAHLMKLWASGAPLNGGRSVGRKAKFN